MEYFLLFLILPFYSILSKLLSDGERGVIFPPRAHMQNESVVSSFLSSMLNGDVFCHAVGAGLQVLRVTAHFPKLWMFTLGCLSCSVACNREFIFAKFWLVTFIGVCFVPLLHCSFVFSTIGWDIVISNMF